MNTEHKKSITENCYIFDFASNNEIKGNFRDSVSEHKSQPWGKRRQIMEWMCGMKPFLSMKSMYTNIDL